MLDLPKPATLGTWLLATVIFWNLILLSFKTQPGSNIAPSERLTTALHQLNADLGHFHVTTSNFDKQTIVILLGPTDSGRVMNLVTSLNKFFDYESVLEILIVTPDRNAQGVAEVMLQLTPKFKMIHVLEDRELMQELATTPATHNNWVLQQVLKLLVANFVKSEFYLILDADVLCFKPTSFRDLIIEHRALCNMYNSHSIVTREDWWKGSETILDMNMTSPTYFGVTPAILSKTIAIGAQNRIKEIHSNDDWAQALLGKPNFTEYCVYATYAIASDKFSKYHIPTRDGVYNHDLSVFWKNQFQSLDLAKLVRQGAYVPGFFVVVQSNTGISAEAVKERMGDAFN
eukprot:c3627_g1_i2.p1 GENE.c3627_g1_i2~~c3627_g1_i2.p1  ORF type:complete len:345 (+),score=58.47 c3627_g1_i2:251-1285(+)